MPEPTCNVCYKEQASALAPFCKSSKKKKKKKKTEQCCIGKQDFERYLKQFKRSILHIAQLLKKKTGWICKTNCRVTWVPEVFFSLVKRSFVGRMPTRLDLTETGNRVWNTSVTQCRRRMGGPTRKSKRRLQLPWSYLHQICDFAVNIIIIQW